jgi:hypothetical protein
LSLSLYAMDQLFGWSMIFSENRFHPRIKSEGKHFPGHAL